MDTTLAVDTTTPAPIAVRPRPLVIQGGMGVGVSGWRLARAVATTGQMGVVSGTALDAVHARQLQDGDPGGHLRRAYAHFPIPAVAERVLQRWFVADGRARGEAYRPHPMLTARPTPSHLELIVLANFAEVWLAKEGHTGPVGINYLEKIQMATAPSAYGAMLAGVDAVLMGAGIPSAIPQLLRDLQQRKAVSVRLDVAGADGRVDYTADFDPAAIGSPETPLHLPDFMAIVSSVSLARFLARNPETRPDGLVVELPSAGGHNAPPRGPRRTGDDGQPLYGPRDDVALADIAALGVPFWLAGAYGTPAGLVAARAAGAEGVQVGTAFAFCVDSGITDDLRRTVWDQVRYGEPEVRTDPLASPSGFPFKVVSVPDTVSEPEVYAERERVCDLGYLRTPYVRENGVLGYRCAAEPVADYVRKGGDPADTEGRKCLCNGLTATIGLGQQRSNGAEPALITAGVALRDLDRYLTAGSYTAQDVVDHLLSGLDVTPAMAQVPGLEVRTPVGG